MRSRDIDELLSAKACDGKVLDIGGGLQAVNRAEYVIDFLPYEQRIEKRKGVSSDRKYTVDTWLQMDVCERKPWPFPDKSFDFAVCSHILEDVRDPVWVCSEMIRVARAGYIETPTRIVEQSLGIEHPLYAGYYHHRWLVSVHEGRLSFRHKPHSLHALKDAIVTKVGAGELINSKYESLEFKWDLSFEFGEIIEFDEVRVNHELCTFAVEARKIPDLLVPRDKPFIWKLKRFIYYQRLKRRKQ